MKFLTGQLIIPNLTTKQKKTFLVFDNLIAVSHMKTLYSADNQEHLWFDVSFFANSRSLC